MLVFGDQVRVRDPRFVVRELAMMLADLATRPPGITRHAALVGAFLEAGELAQALADAETAVAGCDGRRLVSDVAMSAPSGLAHDVAGRGPRARSESVRLQTGTSANGETLGMSTRDGDGITRSGQEGR